MSVIILGGSGRVALLATKLLADKSYSPIKSVIRNADHSETIRSHGGEPVVQSLEDSSVQDFAKLFKGSKYVLWSAGAGGKGGPERTNAVDYEAFVRVLDALDSLEDPPRFLTVSAIDARDNSKPPPQHYTPEDVERGQQAWKSIPKYMEAKFKADQSLSKRTKFSWTILRPGLSFFSAYYPPESLSAQKGRLTDDPATGKVALGRVRLSPAVTRADVASVLVALMTREDSNGMAFDLVNGDEAVAVAVDRVIRDKESLVYD